MVQGMHAHFGLAEAVRAFNVIMIAVPGCNGLTALRLNDGTPVGPDHTDRHILGHIDWHQVQPDSIPPSTYLRHHCSHIGQGEFGH